MKNQKRLFKSRTKSRSIRANPKRRSFHFGQIYKNHGTRNPKSRSNLRRRQKNKKQKNVKLIFCDILSLGDELVSEAMNHLPFEFENASSKSLITVESTIDGI